MKLKVVAITNIWEAKGPSRDFPMWKSVGSREYIIGKTKKEPTLKEIGDMVAKLQHLLEGKITETVIEVFSGYEIYQADKLTHLKELLIAWLLRNALYMANSKLIGTRQQTILLKKTI